MRVEDLQSALSSRHLPVVGVETFGPHMSASFTVPAVVGGLSGDRGRHAFMTREKEVDFAADDLERQLMTFLKEREAQPWPSC